MRVVGTGAHLLVESRHGFEVVVHHVRRRGGKEVERHVEPPAKIRHQDFDARLWRSLAHACDAVSEMLRTAIAQVVPVHAGDYHVEEIHRRDAVGELLRLCGIGRQRHTVADIAEGAAACAQLAEDHESGRALAKAFAYVRAGGFFAYRVQAVLTQDVFHFAEACRRPG